MSRLPQADKNLGQHFLNSQSIIDKIVDDFKDKAEAIIEVGPGPAILTERLSAHQPPLFLVEMDQRFRPYLEEHVPTENIHWGDALDFEWKSKFSEQKTWLVSNLPYNIASPLIIQFLQAPNIKYMTLMMQKEVGQKICPPANTKNPLNSLLALCQNYFEVTKLVDVPPTAFTPPPKVDSIVLRFERREEPKIDLDEFKKWEKFLRAVFKFKRKQIHKLVKPYGMDANYLESQGISPQVRAEALSLSQLTQLYINFFSTTESL